LAGVEEVLGHSSPYVLFVGDVVPKNGLKPLCQAADRVLSTTSGCGFVIAGRNTHHADGLPYERWLRRFISDENQARVRFLGEISPEKELNLLIGEALLCVLPYHSGVTSAVLPRMMAAGKAVIYSKTQPDREVIRHDTNGWLADPFDVLELTESMSALLQEDTLRVRLGAAAQSTTAGSLDRGEWVANTIRLYEKIDSP
jgi:glycosyltransferase involved in cell wall biosynthesis